MKESGAARPSVTSTHAWSFHFICLSVCEVGEWQRHGALCPFCGMPRSYSQSAPGASGQRPQVLGPSQCIRLDTSWSVCLSAPLALFPTGPFLQLLREQLMLPGEPLPRWKRPRVCGLSEG